MVRIENVRANDGNRGAVLDIQVSEVSDLPAKNSKLCGLKVKEGSIAQVIHTGAWYTLDADGQWYFAGGVAPEEGD